MKIMFMPAATTSTTSSASQTRGFKQNTVSFGMAFGEPQSVNVKGSFTSYAKNANDKDFIVEGDARVKNIKVDGLVQTGSDFTAESVEAKNIDVKHNANIKGLAKATETLKTGGNFTAGSAEAPNIAVGMSANIKGLAEATETLRVGGDLWAGSAEAPNIDVGWRTDINDLAKAEIFTAGRDINIKTVNVGEMSSKGRILLSYIKRLDKLFILNNPVPADHEENASRLLSILDFPENLSKKIKIALGDKISELVIATSDGNSNILKKLEFFEAIVDTEGKMTMGERIADEVIKRAVRVVRIE